MDGFTQPDAARRAATFALRHEEDAEPRVAAVYADIRRRFSFVPAVFKALAVQPDALEQAWLQARSIHDAPGFRAATARLRAAATTPGRWEVSAELRTAAATFADELPAMLLLVSSLVLTLDGRLARVPARGTIPPADVPPDVVVPESRGEHPLYDAIRDVYGTAHLPTLYRSLEARGLLEEAWEIAGPLLTGADGAATVTALGQAGETEALAFPEAACFGVESAAPLLDQFRIALPRNLVVAVALAGAGLSDRGSSAQPGGE